MTPAASVSGLIFAHPASRYFTVGRIGRDQVEDYAARRGMDRRRGRALAAPEPAGVDRGGGGGGGATATISAVSPPPAGPMSARVRAVRQGGAVARIFVRPAPARPRAAGGAAARRARARRTLHARAPERAAEARAALPGGAPVVLGDLSAPRRVRERRRAGRRARPARRRRSTTPASTACRDGSRRRTGCPLTFAVNVLAPYLLTVLVARPERLVYLTSALAHSGHAPDSTTRSGPAAAGTGCQAYCDSKLLVTTLAFARRAPVAGRTARTPSTRAGCRRAWAGPAPPTTSSPAPTPRPGSPQATTRATGVTGRLPVPPAESSNAPPPPSDEVRPQEALLAHCAKLTGAELD